MGGMKPALSGPEASSVKPLPVSEARTLGVLLEVNRRLLHPRGLALGAYVATEPVTVLRLSEKSEESLRAMIEYVVGAQYYTRQEVQPLLDQLDASEHYAEGDGYYFIRDERDDPEGIYFGDLDESDALGAKRFDELKDAHEGERIRLWGYVEEPLP